MMERGKAIVFGGTGFLGRRVVQCLLERDFSVRVASRHPERTGVLFPGARLGIESIYADINDDRSVADALADIGSAVNAVSLYAESGQQTFHSVHVTASKTKTNGLVSGLNWFQGTSDMMISRAPV